MKRSLKPNVVMLLTLSIALLLLSGCNTPNQLIKRSQKIKAKLELKGIEVPRDTITVTKSDTVIQTYTINDSIYIIKTITDTVVLSPIFEYKNKWQTKIEYKERIKYIKEETKQEKEKTKQVKAENKGLQWWLLYIGIGLGVGTMLLLKRLLP